MPIHHREDIDRKRRYFVSYAHSKGFGSCDISCDNLQILDVIKELTIQNPTIKQIVVINFIELKDHEEYAPKL